MLTPSGASAAGSTSHSQPSLLSNNINWMADSLPYSRLQPEGRTASASATPRRYTPPSPDTQDLNDFFGGAEWHGVKVQRLVANTSKDDVKMLFLFSSGFDDVRIVKSDQEKEQNTASAYVRFKSQQAAEEAQRFINNREINGTTLIVGVVSRPQQSEIVKMAASLELFSPDYNSQSPSSSDGLSTPAASSIATLGEYTTTSSNSSRQFASPVGNGHGNNMNGMGRMDNMDTFSPMNGNRMTGKGVSDADVYPAMAAFDRLGLGNEHSNGMSGMGGMGGMGNGIGGMGNGMGGMGNGMNGMSGMNTTKPFEPSYMESASLMSGRGMPFHGNNADQMSDSEVAVGDSYGSTNDHLANFQRPRRQTNPAQNRFGKLPPLSTGGVNGFSNASMAPMTAPPIGGPQLASPMSMNSPSANWSSTTAKPYYNNFPITSHPPANPADQNPPCNTLYVGNLPAQTSEDELKALFCRQRGYKRMCFRTKPQGPMCFVEFEDTHYATKALTELYGRALSNSTKGGVRLSFSKNPLGVRSQGGASTPTSTVPKTPSSAIPGPNSHGFPTPLRNPPGLPNPNRQMTPLGNNPNNPEPASQPPPGLYRPSTTPQPVFPGAQSRLPPGLTTSNLQTSSFYGGSTPDLRSPMELRSAVDMRGPPSEMRTTPAPVGTIGNPPRS